MMLHLLGYLIFPVSVVSSLLILATIVYKEAGGVNDSFRNATRSKRSSSIISGWIVFSIAVFFSVQFVRFQIYEEIRRDHTLNTHGFAFYLESALFIFLLVAELLVLGQLLGNMFYSWLSVSRYRDISIPPSTVPLPAVAALIPTCDENPDVLERSISSLSRLDYPHLQTLVIENSRDPVAKAAARQLANRYGVRIIDVENRGTKASALNAAEAALGEEVEYLAIFDADQRVESAIISDLIPMFGEDSRLGWIQTAQLYDSDPSLLNCAISQTTMQSYDNLMEGFSVLGCAFCYGTNFIIRRKALQEVGGWDVGAGTALTEDISTSFSLHRSGWRSRYVRHAYAHGVAPPTLEAFWRQQRRWATGTTYLLLKFLKYFFQGKLRSTRGSITSAYAIALSYYTSIVALSVLIGWPTAILISYLFSSRLFIATTTIPVLHPQLTRLLWLFASLYPFYVLTSFFPYLNMKLRGYRLRNMFLVQSLLILSAPEYAKGVKDAFFNRLPGLFAVTTKTRDSGGGSKHLWQLPQFHALLLFMGSGTIMTHLLFQTPSNYILWIIVFWLFVNSICLGHLFVFYPVGRLRFSEQPSTVLVAADVPPNFDS